MRNYLTPIIGCVFLLSITACEEKNEAPPPARVAPPEQAAAPAESAKAQTFAVAEKGSATFLIDAPLEKIKGEALKFRGRIDVNPAQLSEARGQVEVDLTTLSTHTFDDKDKNAKQTEHARNWLELGGDVPEKERGENQWVRFTITSVTATPGSLGDTQVVDGKRRVEVSAQGDFWLHGVTSKKTAKLALLFSGDATSPGEVTVQTLEPLRVSLKEHDVKPRDLAGKFLQGALEQVGEKIVDEVQLTLEFKATPSVK